MPNIADTLKAEISRIARKEIRGEINVLRKAVSGHRSEIAALKRRAQGLEKELKTAARSADRSAPPRPVAEVSTSSPFSAKGLAAQRRRLGLSADGLARLFGTSAQTVYNWEQGKSSPRQTHLPAIEALKTLTKSNAEAVLATRS